MYTKRATKSETVKDKPRAHDETIFQCFRVRYRGLKEANMRWTVCCDTKVKTKVPRL
jgi:hypothetical protein